MAFLWSALALEMATVKADLRRTGKDLGPLVKGRLALQGQSSLLSKIALLVASTPLDSFFSCLQFLYEQMQISSLKNCS